MLIPNHPDDERLSAVASRDDDAIADPALTSHLSTCARCADLVRELGALRVSLSELPDLEPDRPLRLLPPVADAPASGDGFASWVRRLFAPVVTAGTALALVGVVGTAMPSLNGMAAGGADSLSAGVPGASDGAEALNFDTAAGGSEAAAESEAAAPQAVASGAENLSEEAERTGVDEEADADGGAVGNASATDLPAERSPWPMVLFTGVALVVAAALLRWIVVPRAG